MIHSDDEVLTGGGVETIIILQPASRQQNDIYDI